MRSSGMLAPKASSASRRNSSREIPIEVRASQTHPLGLLARAFERHAERRERVRGHPLVDAEDPEQQLRRTCAFLLLQKNVGTEFVQKLPRHASVAITPDTYSHILPGMDGEAADAIGEALG
ncbi:MAG: hypothetical protein M3N18_09205 [Actinomycetota bacterium]|nr:hypothetical protein [Actinomycetota bacterium]